MKTFPTSFTTEKNRTNGPQPIWILRLTVAGTDYWLCDNAITIAAFADSAVWPQSTAINTLAWVKSWGTIQEGISGALGEFHVADFSIEALIDPDADPNLETLITSSTLEQSPLELYEWFYDCADPPQRIFKGRIRDVGNLTDTTVSLSIQDESILLEKCFIGTKVSNENHPSALPADVGKIIPIPCGAVAKLPGICVDAGWVTTLMYNVLASDTSLYVSELPADSVVGLTIYIDSEQLLITVANTTSKLLTVTRGYNSTVAAEHSQGALVLEKKSTPLVFLFGAVPVTTMGTIYARFQTLDVDITAECTRYTGATGNQLSGYDGQAAVTIATTPAIINAITLALENNLNLSQGNHNHPASVAYTDISFQAHTIESTSSFTSDVSGASLDWAVLYDGNENSFYCGNGGYVSYRHTSDITSSATPLQVRVALLYSVQAYDGYPSGLAKIYINGTLVENWYTGNTNLSKGWRYSGWHTISSWNDLENSGTKVLLESYSRGYFYEGKWEVQTGAASTYSAASGVALTGDLALVGNSTASAISIDALLCDVTNTNLRALPDMTAWLLSQAGLSATIQVQGALPSTYLLNGAITEYQSALYWLNLLAFQLGCWFAISNGLAKIIVRPITGSAKTIPACLIDDNGYRQLTRSKTDIADILNTITVHYDRDWTQSKADTAYKKTHDTADATSQATYGIQERPELHQFDFITSPTMAAAIAALYLSENKDRRWKAEFVVPLMHSELEFGDPVTLGFLADVVGVVIAAGHAPGNFDTQDSIKLTVKY